MKKGETPGPDEPTRLSPVEDLLESCLQAPEHEFARRVESACREHPELAEVLRARVDQLQGLGLAPRDGAKATWSETSASEIGDFELVRVLGRGGMGVVFLARQRSLGRDVALKLIEGPGKYLETVRSRFAREARLASRLRHPSLCPVYEAGEIDGTPYLAMEFIAGKSLMDALEGMPMRERIRSASAHLASVADAAQEIHAAGLVHRDIKPGNILVNERGEAVLVDFGLAIDVGDDDESALLSKTGDLIGTPAYMAPEQLAGRRSAIGPFTDVYALGVSLYEAATGIRPFSGASEADIQSAILHEPVPDPRRIQTEISRDLAAVMEKALEKRPDRRYPNAAEFAEDLRRTLRDEPVRARRVGTLVRATRWAVRHPMLMTLLVVLTTGLIVTGLLLSQTRAALASNRALALGAASRDALALGDPMRAARLARLGFELEPRAETRSALRRALAACSPRVDFDMQAAVWGVDRTPTHILTWGERGVAATWRVTGELLARVQVQATQLWFGALHARGRALVGGEGEAVVLEPDGEVGLRIPGKFAGGCFAADGKSVYLGQMDGALRVTGSKGEEDRWVSGERGAITAVAASPDGRLVFVHHYAGRSGVVVAFDVASHEVLARTPSPLGKNLDVHGTGKDTWLGIAARAGESLLWQPDSGKTVRLRAEGAPPLGAWGVFSHTGAHFLLGTFSGSVHAWARDGRRSGTLTHPSGVWGVDTAASGQVATACADGHVRIFDADGVLENELLGHRGSVNTVKFLAGESSLLSGAKDGRAILWGLHDPVLPTLRGHDSAVLLAVPLVDGSMLTCSARGQIRSWNGDGTLASGPLALGGMPRTIGRAPDDKVYHLSLGAFVILLETDPLRLVARLRHEDLVVGLIWPEADRIITVRAGTSGQGAALVEWRSSQGKWTRSKVLWTDDRGRRVLTCDSGKDAVVVALDDASILRFRLGADGALEEEWTVRDAGISPSSICAKKDGSAVLVNTNTGPMHLIDRRSGKRTILFGHERAVTRSMFSPDGRLVLSASEDGTARLWSATTGELLDVIDAGLGPAHWAAFLPGGDRVLVGFSNRTARVFFTDAAQLLEHSRSRIVPQTFTPEERRRYGALIEPR